MKRLIFFKPIFFLIVCVIFQTSSNVAAQNKSIKSLDIENDSNSLNEKNGIQVGEDLPKKYWPKNSRILFLGNSITYAGDYVAMIESCERLWGISNRDISYINLGLPSETISGLSEDDHADGMFPRPNLFERIERILEEVKPTTVFICYGMNDGIYLPLEQNRFQAFKDGVYKLDELLEQGRVNRIIWITPPVHDDSVKRLKGYNLVLDSYSDWLKEFGEINNREVIDMHYAMKDYLADLIAQNPKSRLAEDGVHPGKFGHWIMAKSILSYLHPMESYAQSWQDQVEQNVGLEQIFDLVKKKQSSIKLAWLTKTKHLRPGIPKGKSVKESIEFVKAIDEEISQLLLRGR